MKGIILEIMENNIIVLTKNGDYKKIRKNTRIEYSMGQEMEFGKFDLLIPSFSVRKINVRSRFALAIAVLIFMIFPLSNYYQDHQVAGYINIDINPSVELSYNNKYEILKVLPLNEDGEVLASRLNLKKLKVEDAVDIFVKAAIDESYINNEKDNGIIISTTEIKGNIDLEKISDIVTNRVKKMDSVRIKFIKSDIEEFKKAKTEKKSPGTLIIEESILKNNSKEVINRKINTYELIEFYNKNSNIRVSDKPIKKEIKEEKRQNKNREMKENQPAKSNGKKRKKW